MSYISRSIATVRHSFLYQRDVLRAGSPALRGKPLHVLRALAAFVDDRGRCWPGRQALADRTSLGLDAVDAALDALVRLRLVRRGPRSRHSKTITYEFDPEVLAAHMPVGEKEFRVRTEVLAGLAKIGPLVKSWTVGAVWLAVARRFTPRPRTVPEIAEAAGVSRRAAQSGLAKLERLGLVAIERAAVGTLAGMLVRPVFDEGAATPAPIPDHTLTMAAVTPAPMATDPGTEPPRPRHEAESNSIGTHTELYACPDVREPALEAERERGLRSGASDRGQRPKPEAVPVDAGQTDLRTGKAGSAAPNPGRASGWQAPRQQAPLLDLSDSRAEPLVTTPLDQAVTDFSLALLHLDLDTPHAARAASQLQAFEGSAVHALTYAQAAEARAREPDFLAVMARTDALKDKIHALIAAGPPPSRHRAIREQRALEVGPSTGAIPPPCNPNREVCHVA